MLFNIVVVLHVIVCLSMITVVLVQRGRGAGLVEALAGAESLFGTKTSGYLVKATTVLAVLFFVFSLALTILSKQRGRSIMDKLEVPAVATDVSEAGTKAEEAVEATVATTEEKVEQEKTMTTE